MARKVVVAGVGMIPFTKPGASETYDLMGAAAARLALKDARVDYKDIQQAYTAFVYGDSCAGQRALYHVGMTGVPIINVNNNCSTGSTGLFLARQAIEAGALDVALVVGFEQMNPGALGSYFNDRPLPADLFLQRCDTLMGEQQIPPALRIFGGAGLDHMERFGTPMETFA
ncbi:MAG: beta-ketoacyl synthase N-terminal-like domain-containing protein, partial [Cupriavidus necator]